MANTSSHQITEVKQVGPWLVLGWVGNHSSIEVDAVVKNAVNPRSGATGPKKKKTGIVQVPGVFYITLFIVKNRTQRE